MHMLNKITDNYDAQARSLEELKEAQREFDQMLKTVESRPVASSTPGSTAGTDAGGRQPALIIGGWNPDQAAEQTLQAAKDILRRLDVPLNAEDLFVPGLCRGYAILPIKQRPFEMEEAKRGRVQQAIQRVRNANVTTGSNEAGGMRKLWIALSQSPERRKRAKLAGKVKRTILELGGEARLMEVEFATGSVWLGGAKVSSATAEQPKSAEKAGAGWSTLGRRHHAGEGPEKARQGGASRVGALQSRAPVTGGERRAVSQLLGATSPHHLANMLLERGASRHKTRWRRPSISRGTQYWHSCRSCSCKKSLQSREFSFAKHMIGSWFSASIRVTGGGSA